MLPDEAHTAKRVQCKNCKVIIPCNTGYLMKGCDCWVKEDHKKGIAVDGGPDYCRYIGEPDNFIFLGDDDGYKI